MIAPYVGMSLYTWTAIIAVVLGGLAVGHWIGGVMADRALRHQRALFWILVVAAFSALATPFILRWLAGDLLSALDPVPAVVALTGVVFFLPSLFAGAVGPLATYLALDAAEPEQQGRVLGRMYALGALGAIAGVLLSGLVAIPWIGSALTVVAVTLAYLASAALIASGTGALGILALSVMVAVPSILWASDWTTCERESAYFCIRVDDLGPGTRVMALDHLAHSVNERDDPQRLHSPYLALIDEIARARFGTRGPDSAFFIGGGAYTLPRAWHARWPEARLTVAEIDPVVTELAAARLWVDPADFEIRHADARLALNAEAEPFDAIIGDAFADISVPTHLVTDEFHEQIAARLSQRGFYAMNVVDLLRRPRFLASLGETLQRRFKVVEFWIARDAIRPGEARTTWIVLASDRASERDSIAASDGTGRAWIRIDFRRMLGVFTDAERVVLTDDHAPVARLLGPLLTDQRYAE